MEYPLVGYYLLKLEAGNVGLPGAAILTLNLGVYAPTGQVTGDATITQAIAPPDGKITVPQVTGFIHDTGFGKNQRLLAVQGQYVVCVPPPAIGCYLAQFQCAATLNEDGTGRATFTYGGHTVTDVPVKVVSQENGTLEALAKKAEPAKAPETATA
ncbi:DUF1842 domain-containing protein [Azospirillum sp.]|uniref:DUF1842 domain-containing protein n=1 Tax=Azospirillum sp. TaxID=34012 RepID=UPI002D74A0B5|nr:DUF1842 domain-containing protein [Azospirillum sp.]HYD69264.1 DUF1842 domain-containing protein [Azospirillum sp.]